MPNIIHQYEPLWGSWYVDATLGSGAYGKVYRVRKEEFGQAHYSAVKIISVPQNEQELEQLLNEGYDEASARSYFHSFVSDILQEIRLMSEFRGNSNIVSFEDYKVIEKEDSIGWDILIRMELLTSLTKWLQDHIMTQRGVVTMGIHICRALELCTQKNTIHRDIKPENIFISSFGEYKLGDFGVARQIERTMSGLSKKGTYTYMAPEVYKGDEYNATVDQYSLGIVMYRLLNQNRPPFSSPFPQVLTPREREEALSRRMKGEPIPPIPGIDPALNAVVLKACAFDRKKRYRDAKEMTQALEATLQSKGLQPDRDKPVTTRQSENKERSGQSGNQRKSVPPPVDRSVTTPLIRSDTPQLMRDAGPSPRKKKPIKSKGKKHNLLPLIVALSMLLVSIVTVGILWVGGVIGSYVKDTPDVVDAVTLPEDTQFAVVYDEVTPTPTLSPTPTPTPTPIPTPTSTPTPTPTTTPTPTPSPSPTPIATPTSTSTFTPTPMPTPTPTPIPTPTQMTTQITIKGQQYSTGSTSIDLSAKQLTSADIEPLRHMTNLDMLNLSRNRISDLSALSGLVNLRVLILDSNQITDIHVLNRLVNLNVLYLDSNQIIDISTLIQLKNLTELHLWNNQISEISALSRFENLTHLRLNNNSISDIDALSQLTNLEELFLVGNQISNISALSRLTNLSSLSLSSNQIIDISALRKLTSLTELSLSGNQIDDISALSGLSNLAELDLWNNKISDISALSGLIHLQNLNLEANPIKDWSPVSHIKLVWGRPVGK